MTTRIELEAMKFYAYHGVMPQEAKVGNHFVVNLVLTASLEQAVKSDELEDTINYATVYTDGYTFQADRTCGRTDFVCSERSFSRTGGY